MKTIEPSNHLIGSGHQFTEYHIETAKGIYTGIAEGNLRELGEIINSVPKDDYWSVTYAFFDLYGFAYDSKIWSMAVDYYELIKHNHTEYYC